jgi:hypothetical protein
LPLLNYKSSVKNNDVKLFDVFYGKAEEDNLEMDWTPKAYVYKSI